jgi:peptidoglycan/xylan/chitin deacetylase (PgdA/CDA1 family)
LPVTPLILAGSTAAVAAAIGGTLTYAALSPGSQLFGPTLIAGNDPTQAALTYDDGPNPAATPELLDILARHNARATFFFVGSFVREQPELVRRVQAAGHLIGNHTQTHPWLYRQTERVIREELRACNSALEDTLGAPVRYLRPPYGSRRPAVLRIARELGLTPVQWNCMGHDWEPIGVDGILARIDRGLIRAQRRGTGANILLHDGHHRVQNADRSDTLRVTDTLLTRFKRDGIHPVTVDAWG